ncbi:reverse transcriptase (RNA-dependent DNA polymerase) [Hirsutella rhossiliensis]
MKVFEVADLQQLWDETVAKDSIFRAAYKAVRDRERAFPPSLGLKIQISECAIDAGKRLTFRDRIWSHDSVATGHPGRKSQLVRRRKGFLKPLPIPDRPEAICPWTSSQICRLLDRARQGVTQKLSTAYHPQTDGGPERMNQEIEAYLRAYVSRLQEVNEYMQAVMASSQQQQEEAANAKRQPAERFEVGDKVWLSMANYRSPRPCKKLDWLHHKYTVTKVISSHVVELDVRGSIYPRFHVDDAQPPPVQDESGTNLNNCDEGIRGQERKNPADADLVGGDKG